MKNEFVLPKTVFYRYLQLRTFVTSHENGSKFHEPTPLESFLMNIQRGKGNYKVISKLYDLFLSMNTRDLINIKQKWETEMKEVIKEDTWKEICTGA